MQVEQAVALIHATGVGTITTLLATGDEKRNRQRSTVAHDAVLAAAATDRSTQQTGSLISLAIGLRAHLGEAEVLTNAERLLLSEILEKLAKSAS